VWRFVGELNGGATGECFRACAKKAVEKQWLSKEDAIELDIWLKTKGRFMPPYLTSAFERP
jgi:hypothetical protein